MLKNTNTKHLQTNLNMKENTTYIHIAKIQAAQPSAPVTKNGAPTYIKYTPAQQGSNFNSGASNRIIRMVEMPKDPLEPPKFKNKRVPRGKFVNKWRGDVLPHIVC
jgi:SNW domain-containing protein 1